MLKTTITKIKKMCALAFVPRILRGDIRYPAGKFEKLSIMIQRLAEKSTDSGSKDHDADCEKCKRLIELTFGSTKEPDSEKIHRIAHNAHIEELQERKFDPLLNINSESESEKCNRIIAQVFGTNDTQDNKDILDNAKPIPVEDVSLEPIETNVINNRSVKAEDIKAPLVRQLKLEGIQTSNVATDKCKQNDCENHLEGIGKTSDQCQTRETEVKRIPVDNSKLQATTSKKDEEKLIQKVESIDETPLVEAANTKIEGLFVSPKVLSQKLAVLDCSDENSKNRKTGPFPESDTQMTLDELAKRCLDSPSGQIDDRLLKEMEKFGMPHAGQRDSNSPLTDEEILQMDVLKKSQRSVEKAEIDLETRKYEKDPISCSGVEDRCLNCEVSHANDDSLVQHARTGNSETANIDETSTVYSQDDCAEEEPSDSINVESMQMKTNFDPNQVLIDPYDKSTIAYDTAEFDTDINLLRMIKDTDNSKIEGNIDVDYTNEKFESNISNEVDIDFKATPEPMLRVKTDPYCYANTNDPIHDQRQESSTSSDVGNQGQDFARAGAKEQISHSFLQPEAMINPLLDKKTLMDPADEQIKRNISAALGPLPKLKPEEDVPLSELLKRVRERNRIEYCRSYDAIRSPATEIDPTEGKCGKKPPACPPPAPTCPPPKPCPPPPCPPPPPPCPKPCKPVCPPPCPPPKKSPCDKFKKNCSSTTVQDIMTLILHPNTQKHSKNSLALPFFAYNIAPRGMKETSNMKFSKAQLTEEVVLRLHALGKALVGCEHDKDCLDTTKSDVAVSSKVVCFARDYEPWSPIPSWPIPVKGEKKPFICPKEGCKIKPPPRLNSPCKDNNPCINFPKRTFSLLEVLAPSLGGKRLYVIGEF